MLSSAETVSDSLPLLLKDELSFLLDPRYSFAFPYGFAKLEQSFMYFSF
jgi:hypothetical protein